MAVSYGDLFISYSKSAPLDVDYKSLFWQIGERRMGGWRRSWVGVGSILAAGQLTIVTHRKGSMWKTTKLFRIMSVVQKKKKQL